MNSRLFPSAPLLFLILFLSTHALLDLPQFVLLAFSSRLVLQVTTGATHLEIGPTSFKTESTATGGVLVTPGDVGVPYSPGDNEYRRWLGDKSPQLQNGSQSQASTDRFHNKNGYNTNSNNIMKIMRTTSSESKPNGADLIRRRNLSPSLDEQISKMFEMKMMPQAQHRNINSSINNTNIGNHNNEDKRKDHVFHEHASEEDPILEKIVSIKWMNNEITSTPTNINDNIPTKVGGSVLSNDAGPYSNQQQQHQQQLQHQQQQKQPAASSKYDHLQKQLLDLKTNDAEPKTPQMPVRASHSGVVSDKLHSSVSERHQRHPPHEKLKRRLPQAIIIGVKKAGTRALLEFLRRHPMVRGAGPEVHFFDNNYHRGLNWYRNKMPPSLEHHLTIEKTPAYYINKMAPRRIHSMSENTKLLLVVRDPVNRLISQYAQRHSRKPNMSKFEVTVVENFANKTSMRVDRSRESVQQGLYAKYLIRWLEYFSLEQIAIINGENLVLNPYEEISKLEKFLGLQPFFTPNHFVPNASRGFPCFRNFKQRLNTGCSGSGNNCEDLSVDVDYDHGARTEPQITSNHRPSKQTPQDETPLSYGNALHILSLPNVSMYFPNHLSTSLSPPPSPSLSSSSSSSSSPSPPSPSVNKWRENQRRHHRHLEMSRDQRKQDEEAHRVKEEESFRDHHHHQQTSQQHRVRFQARMHHLPIGTNKRISTPVTGAPVGLLHCLNEGKGRVHPKVDGAVIVLLSKFYRPHNEKLFALVGQRFDWS